MKATKRSRVLLVDDHPIVREGLAALIARDARLSVCGEADGIAKALRLVDKARPDVVVVDISLGCENGLELVAQMRALSPSLKLLVLSMHDELLFGLRALRTGANGYVMKHEASTYLVEALHHVLDGRVFVSPRVSERLLTSVSGTAQSPVAGIDRLTDRELEIFRLVGLGCGSAKIAKQLHISQKTVDTHRTRIKEKLGVRTVTELIIHASAWTREGLRA